tara:strand:- start:1220 stop:1990 length:771 start_codon:yes stop_codon:yes gene_type:complete
MRLAGKTAIITGAGSGIGRATAQKYADQGAFVICAGLSKKSNDDTLKLIISKGGQGSSRELDVTDSQMIEKFFSDIFENYSKIDILINNAGQAVIGDATEISKTDWERQMDVNLTSIYSMSRAIWAHFRENGGGVILNTASIAGLIGTPGQVSYGVSKAGVVMATKCMALDGAKDNIRVNCVCPGWVQTPMVDYHLAQLDDPKAFKDRLRRLHPLGEGNTNDIAAGFIYLGSDEARWITGIALTIDGGLTCGLVPD